MNLEGERGDYMSADQLLDSQGMQLAIFAAIKAKHENLYKDHSPPSNPLLLELADMILLLSAQMAIANEDSLNSEVRGDTSLLGNLGADDDRIRWDRRPPAPRRRS